MRRLLLIFLFVVPAMASAQNWTVDWYSSVRAAGTTGEYMPFWARTGEDGLIPIKSSGLVTAGADLTYRHQNGFYFSAGTNLAGALAQKSPLNTEPVYGMIDRLYVSGGWKMLHLDLGMKPRDMELSDLSISCGNVMYSRNARNIPGINAWTDWLYFEKGHWVGIKGNLAHYRMIDNRYVTGTLLHNKALSLKFALGRKVDLTVGLEHWAQYGGISPKYGTTPIGIDDYIRIFFAQKGGDEATLSDQVNVLGNHLGKECIRFDWRHSDFTMTVQYDKPFEDGSGMKYRNAPDGVWSLQFAFNDREALVTDFVLEYINTTWQTGPYHDRPATEEEMKDQSPDSYYHGKVVLGGCDHYFGHSYYVSGWSNYGRMIGLPLMLLHAPSADGVVRGVASNRVRGIHAGVKGLAFMKVPYSLKATYSKNYGYYNQSEKSVFSEVPWQLSLAFEAGIDRLLNLPVTMSIGVYGDVGELYQNSAGLTLKVGYKDFRRF